MKKAKSLMAAMLGYHTICRMECLGSGIAVVYGAEGSSDGMDAWWSGIEGRRMVRVTSGGC